MNSTRRYQFGWNGLRWIGGLGAALYFWAAGGLVPLQAGTIVGRVVDEADGSGIEGVVITVDKSPPGGSIDYRGVSGPFGFYRITEVDEGVGFTLGADHPAYVEQLSSQPLLGPDESRVRNFELVRGNPSVAVLDVQVSVRGVKAGVPLEGVPVRCSRFSTVDGSDTPEIRLAVTDSNGNVDFRGFEAGYFRFEINRAEDGPLGFYFPYTTVGTADDLKRIEVDHAGTVLLKPFPQQVRFEVRGFDPAEPGTPSRGIKDVFVELTGFSPREPGSIVLPPRTSVTNGSGVVAFSDLPPIPYKVRFKKLGYEFQEIDLQPDTTGQLPQTPQTVDIAFEPRRLIVVFESKFDFWSFLYTGIPTRLEGIPGTATEGILQENSGPGSFHGTPLDNVRVFDNLLPGKYRVSSIGQTPPGVPSVFVKPFFSGSRVIELNDEFEFEGVPETITNLGVEAAPAVIRGRVFIAEEIDLTELRGSGRSKPIYRQAGVDDIRFREFGTDAFPHLLLAENQVVATDADENGVFTIEISPGLYGIEIPGATGLWGNHIDLRNVTTGDSRDQGWPYPDPWPWPLPSRPPRGGATFASQPVEFHSNQVYDLDLYLHKQVMYLRGQLVSDKDSPTFALLTATGDGDRAVRFYDITTPDTTGHVATAQAVQGNDDPFTGTVELIPRSAAEPAYLIPSVPPGQYTISVNHDRHDFTTVDFTVPEWGAPGVPPPQDPGTLVDLYAPLRAAGPLNDNVFATYKMSPTSIIHRQMRWSESEEVYNDAGTLQGLGGVAYARLSYQHNAVFRMLLNGSTPPEFPFGNFTYWVRVGDGFIERSVSEGDSDEFTIFFNDGPSDTMPDSSGPALTYTLVPRAVAKDDRRLLVPGTTIEVEGVDRPADGTPVPNVTAVMPPPTASISNSLGWVKDGTLAVAVTSVFPPTVEITIPMAKGMVGTVTVRDGESMSAVTEATVRMRDRAAAPLLTLPHTGAGVFTLENPGIPTQLFFVDIVAPGYEPFRARIEPDTSAIPSTFAVTADLVRLDPPTITSASFNRHGLFIPGIRMTGDESALAPADEGPDAPLTATWTVEAQAPANYVIDVPTFDADPAAGGSPTEAMLIRDRIAEIWVVDKRSFNGNPFVVNGDLRGPADPASPADVRDWLRKVVDGTYPGVVYGRASPANAPITFTGTGEFLIPDLPPGDFDPYIVAFTDRGAVAVQENLDYPGAESTYRLKGATIPRWLGFAADFMSVVAAADADLQRVSELVPFGNYTPLENFEAGVDLNAENPTFLDYIYKMGTEWTFGVPTPDEGFLAFAPGVIGMNIFAETTFGSRGMENRMFLDTVGTVANEPAALTQKRLPKIFEHPDTRFEGTVTVTAQSTVSQNYDPAEPYELEVRTRMPIVNGMATGFGFELERPLDDLTAKLPYAGPKLKLLSDLGVLNFSGKLEGFVGLEADLTWRTPFPEPNESGSGVPDPNSDIRANRRHIFGGSVVDATLAPQLRFKGSLETKVASGLLGAEVGVGLSGNEMNGEPFAVIEVNPRGDWPWIKRISGGINLELEARYDAFFFEGEKKWVWQFLDFDREFSTDPFFELEPVAITVDEMFLGDFGPGDLAGGETQALQGFSPLGRFAVGAGDAVPALLYSEFNSVSEMVELKVVRREGDSAWAATAETVASAAVVTSTAVGTLPDGRVLLAWAEIPAASVGNPFPPTDVKFVVEDTPGGTWSAASTVTSLSGAVVKLWAVSNTQWFGLLMAEAAEGPAGPLRLHGAKWNGTGFGGLQSEGINRNCAGLTVTGAGGTAPAVVSCVESGALQLTTWDGLAFSPVATGVDNGTGPLTSTSDGDGNVFVVLATPDGLAVFKVGSGGTFAAVGGDPVLASPRELAVGYLDDPTTPALLAVWSEIDGLSYAFIDPATGLVLRGPEPLTTDSPGSYSGLSILPRSGLVASVVSRFRLNPVEIREFEISLANGTDGMNDGDGDGLDDIAELAVVDADPNDGLVTVADVVGGADFDSDGIPNGAEIELALDPANPADGLADQDGDRYSRAEEWMAGTSDTDLHSRLQIVSVVDLTGNLDLFELTWTSVDNPNVLYDLEQSEDGHNWTPVESGIPATGTLTQRNVPWFGDSDRLFYRVGAHRVWP